VDVVVKKFNPWRNNLAPAADQIKKILKQEIQKFQRTISGWMKLLQKELEKTKDVLPWEVVFKLYDTYGFPPELTKEIAASKGIKVDEEGFQRLMEKARELSRQGTSAVFKRWIDWSKYVAWLPQTQFVGYDTLELEDAKLLREFEVEEMPGVKVLVFDKTPFYPEGGGQTGDKGKIVLDDGRELEVIDTQKFALSDFAFYQRDTLKFKFSIFENESLILV